MTNTSTELLDIRAITLGTFLFNGGGSPQKNDDFARPVRFSLSLGDTVLSTVESPLAGDNRDAATVFNLGANYVSLDAGQAATLKLTAQSAQTANNYGTFVGVKNATFSIIPEPADPGRPGCPPSPQVSSHSEQYEIFSGAALWVAPFY